MKNIGFICVFQPVIFLLRLLTFTVIAKALNKDGWNILYENEEMPPL
jgi:hypothetical protein